MPAPLSDAVRRRLFALWEKGSPPADLARQLGLSPRSVRRLCHAFDRRGAAALAPAYPRPTPATPGPAIQQALLLHQQHPTWGAPYLRLRLGHLQPELTPLPSARTLQRWFRRRQQPPAPKGRKPAAQPQGARQTHATWQMDAVEQLRLATGEQVSWLRWVDEFTGAVLGTAVFPHATFGQVPVAAVQRAVQEQWRRWGRPQTLRVDNGVPWGNWNDLPTPFALWVLGAGVDMHWNDPCCPQQNPKVERSQGTGKRWAEPGRCESVARLQANLDEADRLQRQEYPTAGGPSRLELFPELRHSGRPYTLAWEARNWSLRRVEELLAGYVAIRKVSSTGRISVYARDRYLGQQYRGQHVQVQYDPDGHQWLVSDQDGRELRRHAAPEITRGEIVKFNFREERKRP